MTICKNCGIQIPSERAELFPTCIDCTKQAPYVGTVEGVAKQGSLNITQLGTEDSRRASKGGTAVIRRTSSRKNSKWTY